MTFSPECNEGPLQEHVIRLRRPWEKARLGDNHVQRIDVPEDTPEPATEPSSLGESFRYRRRFNRPTGLQPSSRVHIRISDWSGRLETLGVNGQQFSNPTQPLEINISSLLQPHNEIEIVLSDTVEQPACLTGEVTLLIRS